MIGDEADAFDGLVQFWAVMPMMKRVAESVNALLCRELRWRRGGRRRGRTVDLARAPKIYRSQLPEQTICKMR